MHLDVTKALVHGGMALVDALRMLDETAMRTLFVVDEESRLIGVLTDGDVRRHILAGRELSEPVHTAMNRDPLSVAVGESDGKMRELLVDRRVESLPILDAGGRVVDAVRWTDLFGTPGMPHRQVDVPVAIMAGGKGTRLEPFTRILPKPLMPVGELPVLQLIMDRFHDQGCGRFLVSLNFKAGLIRAYFSDVELPYDIEFFDEDRPLGTAGSLALMEERLSGTFVLANCDTIVDVELADVVDEHRAQGNTITLLASMKHLTLPYGVCEVGEGGRLTELREKPRFDMLVSTGIYVMEPEVLSALDPSGPTDATALIEAVLARGGRVGVYPVPERAWLDIGQLDELQQALDRLGIG